MTSLSRRRIVLRGFFFFLENFTWISSNKIAFFVIPPDVGVSPSASDDKDRMEMSCVINIARETQLLLLNRVISRDSATDRTYYI